MRNPNRQPRPSARPCPPTSATIPSWGQLLHLYKYQPTPALRVEQLAAHVRICANPRGTCSSSGIRLFMNLRRVWTSSWWRRILRAGWTHRPEGRVLMAQDVVRNTSQFAAAHRVSGVQRSGLPSLADVVETLFDQFGSNLALSTVLATARHCRRELDILGQHRPDDLEQLARRRLQTILLTATASGDGLPRSPATSQSPSVLHRRIVEPDELPSKVWLEHDTIEVGDSGSPHIPPPGQLAGSTSGGQPVMSRQDAVTGSGEERA